ncbi:MAG: toll/interleukin-1 receptor domain-containing protein, partial [Anaerolineales bacterium]|nr:toll/interleukin-1 receptor domain-containing protein [Anaerolineales bacterium]
EQEIYRGIEEADAFLFLISPDSVASPMCNKEIAHAVKNGKRILPIVIRDTDPKIIHPEISKRNWIFYRDGQDDFNKAIEKTRQTIHTDYEWLKFHTELQVRAQKWIREKDSSHLLRGKQLRQAMSTRVSWLATARMKYLRQVLTSILFIVKVNQKLNLLINSHKILPASK